LLGGRPSSHQAHTAVIVARRIARRDAVDQMRGVEEVVVRALPTRRSIRSCSA